MATAIDQRGVNVSLPPQATDTTGTAEKKVKQLLETSVDSPTLPQGAAVVPQLQNVQAGEDVATSGVTGSVTADTPTTTTAPTIAAPGNVTSQQIAGQAPATAQSYTATTTGTNTPQAVAAQLTAPTQTMAAATGAITSDATVKGQLGNLSTEIETALQSGGPLPAWARGASRATMAALAKRGLSQSTMYAEAMAEGILNAATPIAAADAESYKQMIFSNLNNRQQAALTNAQNYFALDTQNLGNRQQTALQNIQLRQNTLLSDQAATNASKQFNATNQQQTDQFFSNLSKEINQSNAERYDAMTQFYDSEKNKVLATNANNTIAVDEANAQRETALNQFNAQVEDQRQRFNVENQRVIDQSNATWRRTINTGNTATVNAANQTNARNLLNLSNFAMSSLWQEWRDEASWANTAAENERNRQHNIAQAAINRANMFDTNDQDAKNEFFNFLGKFAISIL